ncbi:hypothetical protein Pla163_02440 [Planctomycetes bacterium Pla163]|uniref:DUF1579 domain-containing protein n=1 Tax=Rohdeia mirabilis TaxID=2528008 RepID=A0A518CV89_9BACT|nr:hypothetical protein Pla163_02440 [Planctomycetes bacterium Pla163]
MRIRLLVTLALSFALTGCNSTGDHHRGIHDRSQVEWVDWGDDPMANPAFMEAMGAAGALGPQHAMLAARAGTWKVEGAYWMAPGGEATPMTATARITSLFGGRFTVESFASEMMGTPYEGLLHQGFDNVTQRYWSIWVDNMNTGVWISHGTEIEPGLIEYHGVNRDIFTPDGRPSRMTVKNNGDGSYTMHMYDFREGTDEYVVMELTYSRG